MDANGSYMDLARSPESSWRRPEVSASHPGTNLPVQAHFRVVA
jgi:hypothetical protein